MTRHVDDLLLEMALEHLHEEERVKAEAHLSLCLRCANELILVRETLALLGDALPPLSPPPPGRERLLEAVMGGRFAPLVERVAGFLGLERRRAGELLGQLDRLEVWEPGPVEGVGLFAVTESRYARGENFVGFVRIEPGACFPCHRHLGEERVLLLQGAYRDTSGEVVRAGEEARALAGSVHAIFALEGPACIGAVVNESALEFLPSSAP